MPDDFEGNSKLFLSRKKFSIGHVFEFSLT